MMRAPSYHLMLVLFVELLLGSSAVLTEPGGFRGHVCVRKSVSGRLSGCTEEELQARQRRKVHCNECALKIGSCCFGP